MLNHFGMFVYLFNSLNTTSTRDIFCDISSNEPVIPRQFSVIDHSLVTKNATHI